MSQNPPLFLKPFLRSAFCFFFSFKYVSYLAGDILHFSIISGIMLIDPWPPLWIRNSFTTWIDSIKVSSPMLLLCFSSNLLLMEKPALGPYYHVVVAKLSRLNQQDVNILRYYSIEPSKKDVKQRTFQQSVIFLWVIVWNHLNMKSLYLLFNSITKVKFWNTWPVVFAFVEIKLLPLAVWILNSMVNNRVNRSFLVGKSFLYP